jgi:hypothetical protein
MYVYYIVNYRSEGKEGKDDAAEKGDDAAENVLTLLRELRAKELQRMGMYGKSRKVFEEVPKP